MAGTESGPAEGVRPAETPRVVSRLRACSEVVQQPAVFSIALNDLANQPASPELPGRMRLMGVALRERLESGCGYDVVAVDSAAERSAELTPGYLYAHPELAVALAARAEAEWIVLPRLNRAGPWVTGPSLRRR